MKKIRAFVLFGGAELASYWIFKVDDLDFFIFIWFFIALFSFLYTFYSGDHSPVGFANDAASNYAKAASALANQQLKASGTREEVLSFVTSRRVYLFYMCLNIVLYIIYINYLR